jgi:thiamine biosynthesis lipoprotein
VETGRVPDDDAVREALRHVRTGGLTIDARRSTARIGSPLVQIDLGGVAKLPILSVGLATLSAHGIRGAMVNGGGDVLASARVDGRPWRIGVRDPAARDTLLAVLPLHAGVVASSGDYERYVMHAGRPYHHVVDPATGRPSRDVRGVTLVADSVARVNGLGTAAMVAGLREGPALLARCGVREAVMVGADGRTWISPALARRLVPPPGRDRIRGLA